MNFKFKHLTEMYIFEYSGELGAFEYDAVKQCSFFIYKGHRARWSAKGETDTDFTRKGFNKLLRLIQEEYHVVIPVKEDR